jgi:hypothetical protein
MSPILAALSKDSVPLAPCSRRAWLVLSPNPCEKRQDGSTYQTQKAASPTDLRSMGKVGFEPTRFPAAF